MSLSQILSFLDLFDNLIHLLVNLTPLKLSLRGLLSLLEESDILFKPSARVIRNSPDLILPAILDHVKISDKLEACTKGFNFF